MARTRLSSKGQIIPPQTLRDAHHWVSGTEFIVESGEDGVLLRPAKPFKPTRLNDVAGSLRYRGKAKTVVEMKVAAGAEIEARRARGRY